MNTAAIIPVYNRAERFKQCLNSLESQYGFKDFYTIVIDDCSTEDIKSVCDEFSQTLHIIYLKTKENCGPGGSRNLGLDWCDEHEIEYVTFIDADDIVAPSYMNTFVKYMQQNPDCDLCYSSFINVFKDFYCDYITTDYQLFWVFSKMYKVSSLYSLRFQEDMPCLEDLSFNLILLTSNRTYNIQHLNEFMYYHLAQDENSLTLYLEQNKTFYNSQEFNTFKAIYYSLGANYNISIANFYQPFFIAQIFNMYSLYETYIQTYPNYIADADNIINQILSFPIIQDILNNVSILESDYKYIKQFLPYGKTKAIIPNYTDISGFYFFKESFYEFLTNHGFTPQPDLNTK